MLTYVRWSEGDADEIAPSLYAARRGFRGTSSESSAGQPSSGQPNPTQPTRNTPTDPTFTPTPVTPIDPVPGSGRAPFTS
ncbi:hypothetical protein [Sandaracinus amylolyticus]|uniref:hypothetical protein n=1 Tax=Sandaracinus amylolyticus TaxID=927083 RepID=UPI001F33486D|nr:hypothetical protein [Sandaracinus amylolyticus]UJR78621.1 Hypothetical protein I5071_6520 [Sandaracinus amylolyticus]